MRIIKDDANKFTGGEENLGQKYEKGRAWSVCGSSLFTSGLRLWSRVPRIALGALRVSSVRSSLISLNISQLYLKIFPLIPYTYIYSFHHIHFIFLLIIFFPLILFSNYRTQSNKFRPSKYILHNSINKRHHPIYQQ